MIEVNEVSSRNACDTRRLGASILGVGCAVVALAGCFSTSADPERGPAQLDSQLTEAAAEPSDEILLRWNEIAVDTIGAAPPFPSTRFMATVQVAVFEAVNAITGKYEPYLVGLVAPRSASPEAAAVAAAAGVLESFFPGVASSLDRQRADSLASIAEGQAKADGVAVGEAAAEAMIARRTGDGADGPPQFFLPTGSAPYLWQSTRSCTASGGAFVHWQNVQPFGIESASQFRASAPPELTSARYAEAYNEVLTVGGADSTQRPGDRTNVALIYAAQPPHQGWNSIARQLARARHDGITRTARMLALLNLSLSDAHISVFESKYFYTAWRPETAIARGDEDGNEGTLAAPFTPLVTTPCFPSYPSAHGAGAGAASQVLRATYGESDHSLTNTHPSVAGVVLEYTALQQIADDVSDARVYGGIHFRFDQDGGEQQGIEVANYNLEHLLRAAR